MGINSDFFDLSLVEIRQQAQGIEEEDIAENIISYFSYAYGDSPEYEYEKDTISFLAYDLATDIKGTAEHSKFLDWLRELDLYLSFLGE